jgi:hypothetical protein
MPLYNVPVKVVTTGSLKIEAPSVAEARDLAECIDVIDIDLTYDSTGVDQLDASVSFLQVEGDPVEAEEEEPAE